MFIFLVTIQSFKYLANSMALLMSACCLDLSPPPSITISISVDARLKLTTCAR